MSQRFLFCILALLFSYQLDAQAIFSLDLDELHTQIEKMTDDPNEYFQPLAPFFNQAKSLSKAIATKASLEPVVYHKIRFYLDKQKLELLRRTYPGLQEACAAHTHSLLHLHQFQTTYAKSSCLLSLINTSTPKNGGSLDAGAIRIIRLMFAQMFGSSPENFLKTLDNESDIVMAQVQKTRELLYKAMRCKGLIPEEVL